MRCLVTGGAGFIGSNLAEKLVKEGHEVIVFDNFSMGKMENISGLDVEVVNGDIRDYEAVLRATKEVDVIFNQAAASSSPMFLKDLRHAVSVNVDGFINLLNASRENGVRKLVYASTSSVYGNNDPPLSEDMKLDPVNFYASTKLLNEHLAVLYSREYGLETIGLRYLSVFGPKEKSKGIYANLASQFLWKMQKNEQPTVYGDGRQTRDFTFVADIVSANLLAMNSKISGEVFNIGTGRPTSLNDLVAIINKILGKSIKPKYVDNDFKNYIATQMPDISKARKLLGYAPEYSLEDGLRLLA